MSVQEEQDWICIVCLKEVSGRQMSSAVQIELDAYGDAKLYFMRHGNCEMNDEARMRLAKAGREVDP